MTERRIEITYTCSLPGSIRVYPHPAGGWTATICVAHFDNLTIGPESNRETAIENVIKEFLKDFGGEVTLC